MDLSKESENERYKTTRANVTVPCLTCDGTGKQEMHIRGQGSYEHPCAECKGTGRREISNVYKAKGE